MFFLDGPGGCGKTFVENTLLAHLRADGIVALAVASSGIASILLAGGRTRESSSHLDPISSTINILLSPLTVENPHPDPRRFPLQHYQAV